MIKSKKINSVILLSLAIFTIVFNGCKEQSTQWEYSVFSDNANCNVDVDKFNNFTSRPITSPYFGHSLSIESKAGWEVVSTFTVTETVFPNFGDDNNHTGIKNNTRTQKVYHILKRPRKDKDHDWLNSDKD